MKTVIPFPDRTRVETEAAQWLVRLDRGVLQADEQRQFQAWLAADPYHREALRRLADAWGELDCLQVLAGVFPEYAEAQSRLRRRWLPALGMVAAAVLVIVVSLALFGNVYDNSLSSEGELAGVDNPIVDGVYRTALNELSEVTLKDGSVLTLNTQSEVRVHFDNSVRSIYLNYGEAHFDVAHNADVPFLVYAGEGLVRAVGTSFNVRYTDNQVEVLVNEGVVEVQPNASNEDVTGALAVAPVRLARGGFANYTENAIQSRQIPSERIDQQLAWRKGKWMFEGESLAEVIREVRRYTDSHIVIADPQIASMRVGGYFDIGDVDSLMKALERSFGIRVVHNGNTYRLEARSVTEG